HHALIHLFPTRRSSDLGKLWLEKMGYAEIGMDHFALPGDELFEAMNSKTLHRNFMGYTTSPSKIMIGLGVSAISDSWTAFAQNRSEEHTSELQSRENLV